MSTVLETPARSYEIAFELQHGQLRAHVTGGDRRLATTLGSWRAIANEARRVRPQTLLVIGAMRGDPLRDDELQPFFDGIAGWGLDAWRTAYVEAFGLDIGLIEMAEIHARERGYDFRVFCHESDAARWLRHGET